MCRWRPYTLWTVAARNVSIEIRVFSCSTCDIGTYRSQATAHATLRQRSITSVTFRETLQTMLDLVPFARAGREVRDRDAQARFIGKLLQLPLPQPQAPAVAASPVGRDQDAFGLGIQVLPFGAPPAANGSHRKSARVVIGPHVDKAPVTSDIVDTVGVGSGNVRC